MTACCAMTRWLRTIPAAIAMLLLAAHFFRGGALAMVVTCAAATVLAFVRHPLADLVVRAALVAGVLVWAHTAWALAQARLSEGRPYLRMVVILGAVAAFTALSAWLLPRAPTGGDSPRSSA